MDFDEYIAANYHFAFIANTLLFYFKDYPKRLEDKWKEVFQLAGRYADLTFKRTYSVSKEEFKQYESIEAFATKKAKEEKKTDLDNLPQYVHDLGELLYLSKYAQNKVKGIKSRINYLNFEWYLHAMRLVLTHAIFESFITITIETICKTNPTVINSLKSFESIAVDEIDEIQLKSLMKKVHKKIGGKSIEGRLSFLRNNCGLVAILDDNRKEMILFLEQVRHIIIHQSGIIDDQFFNRLRGTRFTSEYIKQKTGSQIIVNQQLIDIQKHIFNLFIAELFAEVCQKYLGIKI